MFTGILKKMFVLLNILLWEEFFTDYCHLYIQPHICLTTDVSYAIAVAAPELCKHVLVFYEKKRGKKRVLFIYGNVLEFVYTLEKTAKSVLIMCEICR